MPAHFRFTREAGQRFREVATEERYLLADALRTALGSVEHSGTAVDPPGHFLLQLEGYAVEYRALTEAELVAGKARYGYMITSLDPVSDLLYRLLR